MVNFRLRIIYKLLNTLSDVNELLMWIIFSLFSNSSVTVSLELPVSVVQWADLSSFQPSWDAMEVKGVIADTPSLSALLWGISDLTGLAFDARIHDMVTADGTIVNVDVPTPKGNSVPLFDFKALSGCRIDHF